MFLFGSQVCFYFGKYWDALEEEYSIEMVILILYSLYFSVNFYIYLFPSHLFNSKPVSIERFVRQISG